MEKRVNWKLLIGLVALALVAPLAAPVANAASFGLSSGRFYENFENGLSGWTVTGSSVTTECAALVVDCSLRLDPACCGSYVSAERSLSLGMGGTHTVSFRFKGNAIDGDTDATFHVPLNNGGLVSLTLTHMWGPNNAVRLASAGFGEVDVGSWPNANTWYTMVITLNPSASTVTARIDGVTANSAALGIPASADTLTGVKIEGVSWSTFQNVFNFDDVRVTGAAPAFTESWEAGSAGWTMSPSGVSVDCAAGNPGCSLRLDPPCCSTYVTATHDVTLGMGGLTTVAFDFKGSAIDGDTDATFNVALTNGGLVSVSFTDMWAPNNGIRLHSAGHGDTLVGSWPDPETWYSFSLALDPVSDTVTLTVKDAVGATVAGPAALGIPASADTITSLGVEGVSWSTYANVFHFDNIRVTGS